VRPQDCSQRKTEGRTQSSSPATTIVPFDAIKRGPEERAAMLKRLGFSKFAYDYRAEHVPTFDAEMEALKKNGIELTAWWFPQSLNAEARQILDVLKRHHVKTQLWITGGGEPTTSDEQQRQRIAAEAARLRPIAEEAAKIGCTVASITCIMAMHTCIALLICSRKCCRIYGASISTAW
jgi:hypothetical protein